MSPCEEKDVVQNISLQIGPQLVIGKVKQMKASTKLNVTCCKTPDKVNKTYMYIYEMNGNHMYFAL